MKDNFQHCLNEVLKHEGGFVNHPKDPGGATNMGITRATLSAHLGREATVVDVQKLSLSTASMIYKAKYWDVIRGDDLPGGVDLAVFDFAVNSGPARAAKFLQNTVGALADGKIGAHTLLAAHDASAFDTIEDVCDARLAWLQTLPTFATFGKGWTKRVNTVRAQAVILAAKTEPFFKPATRKPDEPGQYEEITITMKDGILYNIVKSILGFFQKS